ncbi:hypothetical protein ACFLZS_00120 [Patescibacteria group bacterium]
MAKNIKTYDVTGFYRYGGSDNGFTGELSVNDSGEITGTIVDPSAANPERQIYGSIKQEQDGVVLEFVKVGTGMAADVFCKFLKVLKSEDESADDYAGGYKGFWSFAEEIIMDFKDGAISTSGDATIGNVTELTLS